ncbi:MAG: oligopeptide/dipeptide ABC transporter ATP-binding protein, partial [Thalassobaculaceae bacterium]
VCELAERMMVMYAGRKVEEGSVDAVIAAPRHPYTKGLINCVPHMIDTPTAERPPLVEIPGIVPALRDFGAGRCLFAARCAERVARCAEARPEDVDFGGGHRAACWQAGAA